MKSIDLMSWLDLATSTDETRYNLCEIYRDRNHYVGCDGHRLHVVGAHEVERAGFLSGRDAEYPDWKQVVPSVPPVLSVSLVPQSCDPLRSRLRTLIPFLKACDGDKNGTIKLSIQDEGMLIEAGTPVSKISFECGIFLQKRPFSLIGIRAKYLHDALVPGSAHRIHYRGPESPLVVENQAFPDAYALIMPMRFE